VGGVRVAARGPSIGWLALVACVAVGCYLNSISGALIYDDVNAIVRNPAVVERDAVRIARTASWFTPNGEFDAYRPVTTATFAANYAIDGLDPLGYHAVNVALHAAVCVVLALVLAKVTGDVPLSLLAAFLFAAHPVHTEAVASVVGRAELLAALLALLAWRIVLSRPGLLARVGAGLVLAAGVLAKENAAAIVAVAVAADLVYRRPLDVRGYVALAAGVLAALLARSEVLGGLAAQPLRLDNVLATASPWSRLGTVVAVVAAYARLLVWPVHLSADYSFPQVPLATSPADPRVLAGLGVLLVAGALAGWGWFRQRHVCFAIAFAALTFSIVSNLVVPIGTIMGERLLYLPSAGFCLLLAIGIAAAGARIGRGRAATGALASLVIGLYAARTLERNVVWHDAPTFFAAMAADAPRSARSHRELGLSLSEQNRHDDAVAELRTSLRLAPDEPMTLYDLGNVLVRAGRPADAIAAYQRAIERKPDLTSAYVNLGNVHSQRGDEVAAEAVFRRGLATVPAAADLHLNLANALLRQGRVGEAEAEYREAIRLAPRSAVARMNYAVLLRGTGRYSEAAEQLRALVALVPENPSVRVGLVTLLRAAGREREAQAAQADAERLFPGDAGVRQLRQSPGG
jgi:tetratricopeptide (TPR) repeat protein